LYQPRLCCYHDTGTHFVKLNQASQLAMFEAEAQGLQQMLETDIRIPKPLWHTARSAYLRWLELGRGDPILGGDGALSGSNALSHQQQRFWLETIGSTPQINTWTADCGRIPTPARLSIPALQRGGHFPQQERLLAAIPNCWHTNLNPP